MVLLHSSCRDFSAQWRGGETLRLFSRARAKQFNSLYPAAPLAFQSLSSQIHRIHADFPMGARKWRLGTLGEAHGAISRSSVQPSGAFYVSAAFQADDAGIVGIQLTNFPPRTAIRLCGFGGQSYRAVLGSAIQPAVAGNA